MKWWDQMPWSSFSECWVLNQLFLLSSFNFIKRLFSSSLLSAISVVSSAYLRLLKFLPAILIPACASSSPAFILNKQGDNIQPWHTPFPIWNWSVVPCPVLTVASWPACSDQSVGHSYWWHWTLGHAGPDYLLAQSKSWRSRKMAFIAIPPFKNCIELAKPNLHPES